MSKRQFKSQASSGRAGGGFGGFGGTGQSSVLSYIQEPPDYSGISDPHAVVAFKNLSKKDATTKGKALEDLSTHVTTSKEEPEDGLLEAWVRSDRLMVIAVDSDECKPGQNIPSPFN